MARLAALAVAVSLMAAGCAITKIDVDVYKGPLANQEHIQTQQLAVMAVGAKPLLIGLRNTLQWPDGKIPPGVPYERYIDPADYETSTYPLTNVQARRVNAILYLYVDAAPPGLQRFARNARRALAGYLASDAVLASTRAPDLWGRVGAHFSPKAPPPLKEAYRVYLDASFQPAEPRRVLPLREAVDGPLRELSRLSPDEQQAARFYVDGTTPDKSSNALYDKLRDRPRVAAHAKLLFDDPARGAEFVEQVLAIATSYGENRARLEALWIEAVEAILAVNSLAGGTAAQSGRLAQTNERLAELIVQLTQAYNLSAHFCVHSDDPFKAVVNPPSQRTSTAVWGSGKEDDAFYESANLLLLAALRTQPVDTAAGLKRVHWQTKREYPTEYRRRGCLRKSERNDEPGNRRRQFGLVRPPGNDVFRDATRERTVAAYRSVVAGLAEGLERGRLPEGLETLIDEVVEAGQPQSTGAGGADANARANLADALVQFAEKVLVIANHSVLIDEATVPTGDSSPPATTKRRSDVNRYVAVLQAVGNSILVQANELRSRKEHRDKVVSRAPASAAALDRALERRAEKYFEDLGQNVRNESRRADERKQRADAARKTSSNALGAATAQVAKAQQTVTDAAAALTSAPEGQVARELVQVEATHAALTGPRGEILAKNLAPGRADGATVLRELGELLKNVAKPASDYLKSLPDPAIPEDDKPAVFKKIVDVVAKRREFLAQYAAGVEKTLQPLRAAKAKADEQLSAAKEAEARLRERDEAAQAEVVAATQGAVRWRRVADGFDEFRVKVLVQKGGAASAPVAFTLLQSKVEDALRVEGTKVPPDTEVVARLTALSEFLAGLRPPLDPSLVDRSVRPGDTAQDVMDRLVTVLQYEHVLAVNQAGPESAGALYVRDALKAAFEHRSGLTYIRPASVYLRSSYTATSLQDDSGVTRWQNLLHRAASRALPVFSEAAANSGERRARQEINAEIDKQFWQNINSVRVAGAGLTNYVMVKDDIGNWYVKQYSANPEQIIRSAQSLALFNLGQAQNADFLGRLRSQQAGVSGGAGTATTGQPATAEQRTPLERVFAKYKKRYDDDTNADYEKALVLDERLKKDITAAWTSNAATKDKTTALAAKLDAALPALTGELAKLKGAADTEKGEKIVAALGAVKRFALQLHESIAADTAVEEAVRKAGASEVKRVARTVLDGSIKQRQKVVQDYETSIIFAGEAAK